MFMPKESIFRVNKCINPPGECSYSAANHKAPSIAHYARVNLRDDLEL